MSVTVICQGCGHSFPTGPGYQKNKIQCPACGVICPVPRGADPGERKEASSRNAGRPAQEPNPAPGQEGDALLDLLVERGTPATDSPAPPEVPAPWRGDSAPSPAREVDDGRPPPTRPRPAPELPFNCRRCGQKVRRQGECPDCDALPPVIIGDPDAPAGAPTMAPAVAPAASPRLELDAPPPPAPYYDPEEDASPYILADRDDAKCPECRKTLPGGGVVCPSCGFDQRKKKKLARTWEPLARVWETNYTLQNRFLILAASVGSVLLLGLVGTSASDLPLPPFLISWLVFAGFMAFLLGTFERIELTRDRKGHVALTQTWRYCFMPTPPRRTEVRGFGSISSGQYAEVNFWEWLIFLQLFCFGIVPGMIWWYQVIHKSSYFVALTRDHGYPVHYVYRGRSQEQMRDIATTVREATGLPLDT